jgi:hypothetical protein
LNYNEGIHKQIPGENRRKQTSQGINLRNSISQKIQNTKNQQEFVAAFGGQTRESTYRKISAFAVK